MKLKKELLLLFLLGTTLILSDFAFALGARGFGGPSRVRGHIRPKTGAYVAPHMRSAPDKSRFNNWSTKGNTNPYTGKRGNKDPFRNLHLAHHPQHMS